MSRFGVMCPACPRVAGGIRAERWKFSRSPSSAPRDARAPMPSSPITAAAEAAEEMETAAALAPAEGERRLLLSRLLDVRSEPA